MSLCIAILGLALETGCMGVLTTFPPTGQERCTLWKDRVRDKQRRQGEKSHGDLRQRHVRQYPLSLQVTSCPDGLPGCQEKMLLLWEKG